MTRWVVDESGEFATPQHGALLPDGRVVLWGTARETLEPVLGPFGWTHWQTNFVHQPGPTADAGGELRIERLPMPIDDPGHSPFCAGQTLTEDGEVFLAGGTQPYGLGFYGLEYAMSFDGARWRREAGLMQGAGAEGSVKRWYPSVVRLPDGRVLVLGGSELSLPGIPNNSAEVFDLEQGTWSLLATHADAPPEMYKYDFSFATLLPTPVIVGDTDYEVLVLGEREPVLFDVDDGSWHRPELPRPGTEAAPNPFTNIGSAAALLPLRALDGEWGYANGSLLVVGGHDGQEANTSADVYDPIEGAWKHHTNVLVDQQHATPVVLPDGTVLIVGAHDGNNVRALRLDPANGFALEVGAAVSEAKRGYHNVAILLPDGRVLVSGGSPNGEAGFERADFQYYEPGYMRATRPRITDAPAEIALGEAFDIASDGPAVVDAALIALPSVTHSMDWNGRHVQVAVETTEGGATIAVPDDPRLVPPGYYMLFALDDRRIPSEAAIVRVARP